MNQSPSEQDTTVKPLFAKVSVTPPPVVHRSRWDNFVQSLKPSSSVWRTTLLVFTVALFSIIASLVFFWRTLYLPELKQHAQFLATEIKILQHMGEEPLMMKSGQHIYDWLSETMPIYIEYNPRKIPELKDKKIAQFFTSRIAKELSLLLGQPTQVYFQFKPYPQLWIHNESMGTAWINEPLTAYGGYKLELILFWLLGTPIIIIWSILLLVRQLNRPLARLQHAALTFTQTQQAPTLDTIHGAVEIRQVNHAFNQMVEQITAVETERNTMLAGISHDLRSPLTRMRLTAEMISDDYLREGLVYDIEDMDALLQQFLSFMRNGEDEGVQTVDFNHIIQEVIVQFQPLKFNYSPISLPPMQLRPLSIKRVVVNLVSNAQRYGAEPIDIELSHNDHYLLFTLSDNGSTPISQRQDNLQDLFLPFVRGEAARTQQGSGLGLSIVERIVRLHGGEIKLSYTKQGGFRFKIKLPIHLPPLSETPN